MLSQATRLDNYSNIAPVMAGRFSSQPEMVILTWVPDNFAERRVANVRFLASVESAELIR